MVANKAADSLQNAQSQNVNAIYIPLLSLRIEELTNRADKEKPATA
jgi:hypothetical protein